MEITVFAKRRTSKEGKTFYTYLTTLTKKSGEKQTVAVKFRDEATQPEPKHCPMNIEFDKCKGNLSSKEFVREDTGEVGTSTTLWIAEWRQGTEYVDHSLDDFE